MGTILHLTGGETVSVEGTMDDVAMELGKPATWLIKLEVEGGGGEAVVVAVNHVTYLSDATMPFVDAP